MTIIAIILFRILMHYKKVQIYEWYVINKPKILPECAFCFAYNFSLLTEGLLWLLLLFEFNFIRL